MMKQHASPRREDPTARMPAAGAVQGGMQAQASLRPAWMPPVDGSPRVAAQRRRLEHSAQQASLRRLLPLAREPARGPGVAQAKFWGPGWSAVGHQQLVEAIQQHTKMPLGMAELQALEGMAAEEVEYQLPEDPKDLATVLPPLIRACQKQDKINLTKLFSIINSVLNHGILNQRDRMELLGSGDRATTSTDSAEGSEKIHGMMLNQPADRGKASKQAQNDSVNVLAEVKDDLLFGGVRKRLAQGQLTRDERRQATSILQSQQGAEFYQFAIGQAGIGQLLKELADDRDTLVKIDLRSDFLRKEIRQFALERIANSRRGRNEMQKRAMSGFLTIFDADQLTNWDAKPGKGHTGEGTLSASQPANRMLKMVLPKYLERYQDRIENPHGIPIVYQAIAYPAAGEVHVYFPNGDKVTLRNEIDLRWYEQIQQSLLDRERVFTHMVRGF
jgi:hypothetical protein